MNYPTRNEQAGAKAAFAFGAEYQANPGSSRREYLDSAAYYFGPDFEKVSDLSENQKEVLFREFQAGIAREKSLQ